MPRGRYSRGPSPSSSLADSRSPSPLYSRPTSRSRTTRRSSFTSQSPVRSRPQSRSRRGRRDSPGSSRSSSRSSSRGGGKRAELKDKLSKANDKVKTTSGMKTSLVFLGSVAAATYAAHKFWPKGITYGEKEEWECEKKEAAKKEKRAQKGEDPRGQGGSQQPGDSRLRADDGRGARDYDRPRSSRGRLELENGPIRRGERLEIEDVQVTRRPASVNRGYADGYSMASNVGASRLGDARRQQYVEETRIQRSDRGSYADERDRGGVDAERVYRDYQPAPQYVQREVRTTRATPAITTPTVSSPAEINVHHIVTQFLLFSSSHSIQDHRLPLDPASLGGSTPVVCGPGPSLHVGEDFDGFWRTGGETTGGLRIGAGRDLARAHVVPEGVKVTWMETVACERDEDEKDDVLTELCEMGVLGC
ncbi:hypothetical protein BJ170DRAFT_595613 [Xylariales sp. AK1849]|nr:hypothetical protein BJ170DRAFT_595613 [Xylariales sp. AK1849]